jgi:hypothetical protein
MTPQYCNYGRSSQLYLLFYRIDDMLVFVVVITLEEDLKAVISPNYLWILLPC